MYRSEPPEAHSRHDRPKRIVVVAITIVVIEREDTRISPIIVIAPTFEDRVTRVRKISVVQFNPSIFFRANLQLTSQVRVYTILNLVPVFILTICLN